MARTQYRDAVAGMAALLAVALAPSCDSGGAERPPFAPVASIHDLMHDVIYPHAETYWDSVGTIIDEDGTHEIRPESDDEWEKVVQSAFTLAEAGNLLMMEGRAKDSGPWMLHAKALIEAASTGIEAAQNRDPEAVFDTGGFIYEACDSCHEQYWEKPPSAMRP